MSAPWVPLARQVSSPRFELVAAAQVVTEDALKPPFARLASANFASGADVAEVVEDPNSKTPLSGQPGGEPGVEIIKSPELPPWLALLLGVSVTFSINGLLSPVAKVIDCFTVQPELIKRGTLRKPWKSLSQTFFALGASEGLWSLTRGSFFGSLGHLVMGTVSSRLSAITGVVRSPQGPKSLREFAASFAVESLAFASAYGLFSLRFILSTDFATETKGRMYTGALDVVRKGGASTLYRGLGFALTASLVRDVAKVLRLRSKSKLMRGLGWALILGVCPFLEIATARAAVGGFKGMGPLAIAKDIINGPWTVLTLLARV